MKILFFLHPTFFGDRLWEIQWLDAFIVGLREQGHHVDKFLPYQNKIADYDLIHVFSSDSPETWFWLKNRGKIVFVTPSLSSNNVPRNNSSFLPIAKQAFRLLHAVAQMQWPPCDRAAFLSCVDRYLVISAEWGDFIQKQWGIKKEKISFLRMDPKAASRAAYRQDFDINKAED